VDSAAFLATQLQHAKRYGLLADDIFMLCSPFSSQIFVSIPESSGVVSVIFSMLVVMLSTSSLLVILNHILHLSNVQELQSKDLKKSNNMLDDPNLG